MKNHSDLTTLPPPELSEKLPCLKGIKRQGTISERSGGGRTHHAVQVTNGLAWSATSTPAVVGH
ncbi:MAG: hypothetical protein KGQ89_08645 [Verrucomicrobia bacterium]|nr:hypothetical protein [Verrucomicrobiota bacterium]